MGVKQANLKNRRGSDEIGILVELRAGLHTTTTGNTARKRISLFLLLRTHARTRSQIVAAIDGNPGFHRLQVFEQNVPINRKITDHWELGKRFQPDGLLELVYEGRARHASPPVDEHGAGAANFLKTIGVVGDRRSRLAIA